MNIQQINAAAEGWSLAYTDSGPRIRKDDESSLFASDDHVLEVLQDRAAFAGDKLSAAALTHHYASVAGLDVDPIHTTMDPTIELSPCPKCGSDQDLELVRNGNKRPVLRCGRVLERRGSFVRCVKHADGGCHCGPWINRSKDTARDVEKAIAAWNQQTPHVL